MKNVDFAWLLKLVHRHLLHFCVGVAIGLAMATAVYVSIPPKYKSIAKISVSPRYFQSPMMRDFLPEIYDPNELRAERETALAAILTPEFLSRLQKTPLDPAQIDQLRRSFEILRENATTFQISAIARSSARAHELTALYLQQVETDLSGTRLAFIRRLRDSVRNRIQSLSPNTVSQVPSTNASPTELAQLKKQRQELLAQFKPDHPAIQTLDARLKRLGATEGESTSPPPSQLASSQEPIVTAPLEIKTRLLEDLLRKYEMLEIVLDLEQSDRSGYVTVVSAPTRPLSPISPQPLLFISWGLVAGLLLGMGLVLWREQRLATKAAVLSPRQPAAIFAQVERPNGFIEKPVDKSLSASEAST
jgi:uncharacterized protein involved in exopolysaccharide biosynthesis